MAIQLSDHFSYKRLLRFTLPAILGMVFTSIYGVVDGFFVSNFVGKTPFTGLNLIVPAIMVLGAVGNMVGVGGSALISKTLGEGKRDKANKLFSFFTYFMIVAGLAMSVLGNLFLPQIAVALGAEGEVLTSAVLYGRVLMWGVPVFALQYSFQSFLITAEKPQLGLYITVAAGMTNIVLDALFIVVFQWGLVGAAAATLAGQAVGAFVPMALFARKRTGWVLHLGAAELDWKSLWQACSNGISEFLSNISMSVVAMLFNAQLLKYAGNDGVAAYGVIMYVNMIFVGVLFGFTMGISPVIGYHFGAKNTAELKSLLKKSGVIVAVVSVTMMLAGEALARPLALLFASYDAALLELTVHAFSIYSISFLLCGVGIFGSALFTALNNGPVSAMLSVLRTFVFQVVFVLVLPMILGIDGIWWSVVVSEGCAAVISLLFIWGYRKRYHYL